MSERPRLKLFGGKLVPAGFVSDLQAFLELDNKLQEDLYYIFNEIEMIDVVGLPFEKLAKKYLLPINVVIDFYRVISYILRMLADKKINSGELETDLSKILKEDEVNKFMKLHNRVTTDELLRRVWRISRITTSMTTGLPRFVGFGLMPDYRLSHDEETYEFVDKVPVILFELTYLKDQKEECTTVQFTQKQFEIFVERLKEMYEGTKKLFEEEKKLKK